MAKAIRIEELDKQIPQFFAIMNESNDLACVLLGVNFLDDTMRAILAKILKKSSVTDAILNPSRGFLGTFSSRRDLLYCMGLVEKKIYEDLCTIAEIRNIFAHSFDIISFDSEKIVKLLIKLVWYDSFKPKDNIPHGSLKYSAYRYRFTETVSILGAKLILLGYKEIEVRK